MGPKLETCLKALESHQGDSDFHILERITLLYPFIRQFCIINRAVIFWGIVLVMKKVLNKYVRHGYTLHLPLSLAKTAVSTRQATTQHRNG